MLVTLQMSFHNVNIPEVQLVLTQLTLQNFGLQDLKCSEVRVLFDKFFNFNMLLLIKFLHLHVDVFLHDAPLLHLNPTLFFIFFSFQLLALWRDVNFISQPNVFPLKGVWGVLAYSGGVTQQEEFYSILPHVTKTCNRWVMAV